GKNAQYFRESARAARWLGIPYPVNSDLLRFLDQGIDPARKVQDKYTVKISAWPVNVNDGAEKPQRVRLRLECGTEAQILDNYNYEISKDFVWEPARCGKVTLEMDFGAQHVDAVWDGEWAFQHFLRDFSGGELTFTPRDFPGKEDVLKNLDVNEIRVRYAFTGAEDVLKAQRYTTVGLPREAAVCRSGMANVMGEESALTGVRLRGSKGTRP
ncbi:MAG: hypothetical protein Q4F27_01325, partial [Desulfovibrionaceae bacterium]|nr:hypothetical protein [Desulfovibrionaceae bacterium]